MSNGEWRLDPKGWPSQRLNQWSAPKPTETERPSGMTPVQAVVGVVIALLWLSVLYAALGWLVLNAFERFGWVDASLSWTELCLLALTLNVVRLADKVLFRRQ